jgi:hypothetical protein
MKRRFTKAERAAARERNRKWFAEHSDELAERLAQRLRQVFEKQHTTERTGTAA